LSSVLGALASGASPVVAVDLSEEKLALARSLGAVRTVSAANPDAVEQVRALTGGGADFTFEMAGSARALEAAWRMTRRGGTTITAGLPPPDAALAVNVVQLVAEERTLKGSYIGTCVPSRDIPRFIRLFREGRLPVDRLLTGTVPLDRINEAFDQLADGKAVRTVVTFP
jgi:alcohol dehydrogenase